jgi:hypothetical protein
MSKAIRMNSGASSFLIETDESVPVAADLHIVSGQEAVGVPQGMQPVADVAGIRRDFSEVKDLIVACSNSLFEAIPSLKNPEKVAVEFGIKLAGEAGVPMLTKASGEANFKVSIEWGR